jgi:serine/threonine protein kinase
MSSDPDSAPQSTAILVQPLANQMLKQFRLEGLLGEGGMGLVYRAYDTRLHRPVAVKLLSSALTADPQRKQRFFQEARAAARISHPAVAQIFDADEQDSTTFIVMELVEGKTVQQLIQGQELDVLGAIDIGIQVADGLAKAHSLGIVHRDIKPANVMRTSDGHVKILDFGLAKWLEVTTQMGPAGTQRLEASQIAHTRTGIVMGTPAYMSPEQVRGLPVDLRADIFALGVMLFEMATGQSPFRRENFMDALHAAAFEETPPMNSIRPQVPEQLQRIVERCLKKQPEDRYPNARSLAEDLRVLRRNTEAGVAQKTTWRQRLVDAWEEIRQLSASRAIWYVVGLVAVGVVMYWSVSRMSAGTLAAPALAVLFLFRQIRNQPQRMQEKFVRRTSKIPEVRMVVSREHQITVIIDQPVAQLYGRLNGHLRSCNRKLFFGPPMTLTILHDQTPEQTHTLLASPGVHYVRDDVVAKSPAG